MQLEKEQELLLGAELGHDANLIPESAMLSVVFHLFGDIDYIDP